MKAAASSVSGSVTGSRLMISRPTGTSYWIDTPRSPRTAWASQSTYWTTRGRSSPSDVRSRAVASGLPSVPMMTCAGSPGRTRITTKTRRDTTKRVATSAALLRSRYRRKPLVSFRRHLNASPELKMMWGAMTGSEYQDLVEFLGRRFEAIDGQFAVFGRRFDALDQRFDAFEQR